MIWLHGVSVGESLANLTLAQELASLYPDQKILLTSTTETSKSLIMKHVGERIFYEKYPLDLPWLVNAFLDKWKPKFVIFGESELWPVMLGAIRKRKIPAALINARLSEKSFKRWSFFSFLAKQMLSSFDLILAQSKEETERYKSFKSENVYTAGNLKFAAAPLAYDDKELSEIKAMTGDRPTVVFASTHAPEELIAYEMHHALTNHFPNLLSIIVPRHPERGEQIAHDLGEAVARRSLKQPITAKTAIYLADTLGELGLFYALCPIAFIGNSLTTTPGGGHNPIEPAHLDCAIVYGPEMFNFKLIDQEMLEATAVIKGRDKEDVTNILKDLLTNTLKAKTLAKAAKKYAQSKRNVLPEILEKLTPLIDTALNKQKAEDESPPILVSKK